MPCMHSIAWCEKVDTRLPAFAFAFCRGKEYHYRDSASEVGILAGLGAGWYARRAAHRASIYSFVVLGRRAAEILDCSGETAFGAGSTFELFRG